MKNAIILILIVIVVAGGVFFYIDSKKDSISPKTTDSQNAPSEIRVTPRKAMTVEQASMVKESVLSAEVEAVLAKETEKLKTITSNLNIIAEIKSSNDKDIALSPDEITKLDELWLSSKTITPFIQSFLSNKIAEILIAFQKTNPDFKEIFIANAYGLNAGQTDKTSDYYQADESWFINSMAGGVGKVIHGKIEFDDSSQTEAISIYVPIMDGGKAIGVLKGVLDLSSVKSNL